MDKILVVVMALACTLGIAGLSFSEDMKGMNHGNHADQKVCANVNCCASQMQSATKNFESKITEEWNQSRIENLKLSEDR